MMMLDDGRHKEQKKSNNINSTQRIGWCFWLFANLYSGKYLFLRPFLKIISSSSASKKKESNEEIFDNVGNGLVCRSSILGTFWLVTH
jgi:hypothetical protein